MYAYALSALVPRALIDHLRAGLTHLPSAERGRAAILFADISGFTSLSERLAEKGTAAGVEELSRLLNLCFGRAVDVIAAHGGDILRFAGDAPIAIFQPSAGADPGQRLADAIARAASCGLALQDAMARMRDSDGVDLAIRVGVGAGDAVAMTVGGIDDRREFIVGGGCVDSAVAALALAAPGDVVLAGAAAAAVPDRLRFDGDPLADGACRITRAGVVKTPDILAAPPVEPAGIRPFIPRSVLHRLDAGQADWVAELRRVTVLFIHVRGLDFAADRVRDVAQEAFSAIQAAVYGAEGSINQFLVDDKGVVALAAWGVPGRTHEDDAGRAASAALQAAAGLGALGLASSAGLATGRAFCGWRGNASRREFALIGQVVSLAARLAGGAGDGILCDRPTRETAARVLDFESAGTVIVKGFRASIDVFRPLGSTGSQRVAMPAAVDDPDSAPLVGRAAERAIVDEALTNVQRGGGATLVFEGEPGVGKSAILAEAVRQARRRGVPVLAGEGNSVAAAQPYHAWRTPLGQLLGQPPRTASAERIDTFLDGLRLDPDIGERAPLVARLLGIEIADTQLTARMTDTLRFENTRDLVVRLLDRASQPAPLVLVLDDAQWLDSASWGIALGAHRRAARLLVIIGTRPSIGEPPPECAEILRGRRTTARRLDRLSDTETIQLACHLLRVDALPLPVVRLLRARTEGHPLFVAELSRALRDGGFLTFDGGTARLSRDAHDLDLQQFPETVQDAVAGRLGGLSPAQQLTVKVASVVGAAFSVRALLDVHPLERDERAVVEDLAALERAGVLAREGAEADVRYVFQHSVIQEVAYGLLVSAQQRELHTAVAEWYERAGIVPTPYALLAHHWSRANDHARALDALEHAGARASDEGAPRETIRFFQQALDLAVARKVAVDAVRKARWLRELGGAHVLNSAPERAREALDAALALIGQSLPHTRAGLAVRLAREAARQTAHLVRSESAPRGRTDERQVLAVEILRVMSDQAFMIQDQLELLTALLTGINLAESTGNTRAICGVYTAGGYVAALFGLERLARRWWARAERSDEPRILSLALNAQAMHAVDVTQWDDAERLAERALAVSTQAGAHIAALNAITVRMFAESNRGNLDGALRSGFEALARAETANVEQRQVWALHAIATCLLAKEERAGAWLHTRQAIDLMTGVTDPLTVLTHVAHRLEFAQVAGDDEDARGLAAQLLALITSNPPSMMGTFNIYFHLIEFFLDQWERGVGTGESRAAARDVQENLRPPAPPSPPAPPPPAPPPPPPPPPRSTRRARRLLMRSAAIAAASAMPIQEALAYEELARLPARSPAERATHLQRAHALFASHGYLRFQHRVEAAMAEATAIS